MTAKTSSAVAVLVLSVLLAVPSAPVAAHCLANLAAAPVLLVASPARVPVVRKVVQAAAAPLARVVPACRNRAANLAAPAACQANPAAVAVANPVLVPPPVNQVNPVVAVAPLPAAVVLPVRRVNRVLAVPVNPVAAVAVAPHHRAARLVRVPAARRVPLATPAVLLAVPPVTAAPAACPP